jgi:uncharacterized protein YndB with AHSA1/START domain
MLGTTGTRWAPGYGAPRTVRATGHALRRSGQPWIVYTRRLRAAPSRVWRAMTDPAEIARWVGTWRAVRADGVVEFFFTFEGDDLLPVLYRLDFYEEGRRLGISMHDPEAEHPWRLEAEVSGASGGGTTLTVSQGIVDPSMAPSMATGCEYYLDRMVALVEGRDPQALDFDDYFLAQADHYRQMFPVQRRPPGAEG